MKVARLCVFVLMLSANAFAEAPQELRGTAVAVADGRVLYTEHHRWRDAWHRAEYRAPDGTLLAVNELDYSAGPAQPAYTQVDMGNGDRKGARWDGHQLTLFHGDRSKVMRYREPLVISSGFHNFLLERWDALAAGKKLVVDFAVPEHLSVVRLNVQRIKAEQSDIPDRNPGWIYFRVKAANPVLGWFVDPVDLAYDGNRHLRVYRGTSDIEVAGKTPAVEIRY